MEFFHWIRGCWSKRIKHHGPIQVYNNDEKCWEVLNGYVVKVCDECGREFAEIAEKETFKKKIDRRDFLI